MEIDNIVYILLNPYFSSEEKGQSFGGHISHAVGIIEAFGKLGCPVAVVSNAHLPYDSDMVEYTHVNMAKPILKLPIIGRLIWDAKVIFWTMKLVFENDPDFLYVRFAAKSIAVPVLRLLSRNVKIVLEINEPAYLIAQKNPLYRLLAKLIDRLNLSSSDVAILVCISMKEAMTQLYPRYISKYILIPNGVDLDRFTIDSSVGQKIRAEYGIKEDDFVIGFSGNFMKYHAIDVLIEAFSEIAQSRSDVHLFLIGDGIVKDELIYLAESLGIKNIVFTGSVPFTDMPKYLSACDILSSPSERVAITKLCEYMAIGKCVVASDQHEEIIEDNHNGVIFETGSVEDLSEKLLGLVEDPERIRALGLQARRDAVELHSWKKRVLDLLDFCEANGGTDQI